MRTKKTITVETIICNNCRRPVLTPAITWWEGKTGDEKSLKPVDGWTEKHNCGSCLQMGYEIAEVMG